MFNVRIYVYIYIYIYTHTHSQGGLTILSTTYISEVHWKQKDNYMCQAHNTTGHLFPFGVVET